MEAVHEYTLHAYLLCIRVPCFKLAGFFPGAGIELSFVAAFISVAMIVISSLQFKNIRNCRHWHHNWISHKESSFLSFQSAIELQSISEDV